MHSLTALLAAVFFWSATVHAGSFYPTRPDDPRAVDFTREAFGAQADGTGDDSDALQRAIDRVQETTGAGVLLIPEGRYRLGKTIHVWQGIRLLGYGATRPVFVLGQDTPGFQEGSGRYMVHFADNRPDPGAPIVDATEFTFFSGMSNIDFELQDGNPAAIAVRFHVAQHSELTHMNFRVGTARAAVEDIGNQASDIHVEGGDYGIITRRTAPVWQFLLMDSSFEGQRTAAIKTQEAGFTLIRVSFSNMPVALQISPGEVEQLYGRDLRMENIRDAAFVAGNARNPHSAVTLVNVACTDVPHFSAGEQAIKAPARHYVVDRFSQGLMIGADGREQGIALRHRERALAKPAPAVPTDIPATPAMENWVNVHSLGVTGDGKTDDTDALLAAIEKHAVLFFPSGIYRVSRPLTLKPDTVLIGLNPATTQISLIDSSPAFARRTVESPGRNHRCAEGRQNIVRSISITTGSGNPRAAAVIWMAGVNSLLDDVSFPGQRFFGSGFRGFGFPRRARRAAPATQLRVLARGRGSAHHQRRRRHLPQQLAAWHEREDRTSRGEHRHAGKIYQMSVEHHMRVEAEFHNVRRWEIYAFQTEEENPAGANAYALDIEDSAGAAVRQHLHVSRVAQRAAQDVCDPHASLQRHRVRKHESVQPDAARVRQRGVQRSQWRLRAFAFLHALHGECRCEAPTFVAAAGVDIRQG